SATLESGRGVGMAALLDSVDFEGGAIEVETQPGAGTTFRIRVPKAAPPPRPSYVRPSLAAPL
ncbi:MAG TPA: two-component sensor histidine kinase, partial [Polyangiales bacterium]